MAERMGLRGRSVLGIEPGALPAIWAAGVEHPIVQAVGAAAPELDGLCVDGEAGPVRWARNVAGIPQSQVDCPCLKRSRHIGARFGKRAGKESRPIATQSKEPAEGRLGKAIAGCKWIEFYGSPRESEGSLEHFAPLGPTRVDRPGGTSRPRSVAAYPTR